MRSLQIHIEAHTTDVLIGRGLLQGLDSIDATKVILLIDENVFRIHETLFKNRHCILIPEGEKHKTPEYIIQVYRQLLEMEADRTSFIVGIGGGLVTDVAGFVASTFMRGIRFGFISTTLLGQVDASIGGKNGVNLDGFKNMIGVIRQPEFVWCDLDLLHSLPEEELRSGFSEVIKYGAIKDRSLFELLESSYDAVLKLDPELTEEIVARSAAIKADIVTGDVYEKGERKFLNFGHTLGHAVEKLTGMLHGEAVATGMVLAARLSVKRGFLESVDAERIEKLIRSAGLPVATNVPQKALYEAFLKDKKRAGDCIHFILLKSIGEAFIYPIKLEELKVEINDLY